MPLNIGVALLTYSRPTHTRRVLEGLRREGVPAFTVYMDGADDAEVRAKQTEMAAEMAEIDWADCTVIRGTENVGLARSVVGAVTDQLKTNDAMILLEDDCVPRRGFLDYFRKMFETYRDTPQVRSVCGYQFPFASRPDERVDTSLVERFVPWGWGTWRDRWADYDTDLEKVVEGLGRERGFDSLPEDLKAYCRDDVLRKGRGDIWSLNWVLEHYRTGTHVIYPSRTLIDNIGFDGTGAHCVETSAFDHATSTIDYAAPVEINLPRELTIDPQLNDGIRRYLERHSPKTMFSTRSTNSVTPESLPVILETIIEAAPVFDIHTHLFPAVVAQASMGADALLTYHYLTAEALTTTGQDADAFFGWDQRRQARFVWEELFVKRTPLSEATSGVVTVLETLGVDVGPFPYETVAAAIDAIPDREETIFRLARVQAAVMTNDPFDAEEWAIFERKDWDRRRFRAAVRLDALFAEPERAMAVVRDAGFDTVADFLRARLRESHAAYVAVSLDGPAIAPLFASDVVAGEIMPMLEEMGLPFALMVGVTRRVNPALRQGGDGLGSFDHEPLAEVLRRFPANRFMLTVLGDEMQHAAAVLARKFPNLHLFGFWWFSNNPAIIEQRLAMRFEMLGFNFTPQHSDARVTEQLLYKWTHFKAVLKTVMERRYRKLLASGWPLTLADLRRDVHALLHDDAAELLAPKV